MGLGQESDKQCVSLVGGSTETKQTPQSKLYVKALGHNFPSGICKQSVEGMQKAVSRIYNRKHILFIAANYVLG